MWNRILQGLDVVAAGSLIGMVLGAGLGTWSACIQSGDPLTRVVNETGKIRYLQMDMDALNLLKPLLTYRHMAEEEFQHLLIAMDKLVHLVAVVASPTVTVRGSWAFLSIRYSEEITAALVSYGKKIQGSLTEDASSSLRFKEFADALDPISSWADDLHHNIGIDISLRLQDTDTCEP